MVDRFPDVDERVIMDIFWHGMNQGIRSRVREMGANLERSSMKKIVKYVIRAEDGILNAATHHQRELVCTWGNPIAYRTNPGGLRGSHPPRTGERPGWTDKKEYVRANAVTPQPQHPALNQAGPPRLRAPRPEGQCPPCKGKNVSRAKRDQLRAENKCFQCEQPGHSQHDCPELNTMRPPTLRSGNIKMAWLESLSMARDQAALKISCLAIKREISEDDATPEMQEAYQQCTAKWGEDNRWLNPDTRWESKYGIYQYGTNHRDLIEVVIHGRHELGTLEVDVLRFSDRNFDLTKMLSPGMNTLCVQESGFRDCQNYDSRKWTALQWLKDLIKDQLEHEKSDLEVNVLPTKKGYGLGSKGGRVLYEVTHTKVLGCAFHIGCILKVVRTIIGDRDPNDVELKATSLSIASVRQQKYKLEVEGASAIEKTSMRVKDWTRKTPETLVVLAKLNRHKV